MATSQELNPVRVLHSISGSYEPLSLVGTQAATRLPQVVYFFLVHSCLVYLLPLGRNHSEPVTGIFPPFSR
ncbi:hypothetical protein H6F96_02405 [Microcoleus sp. FACHB-53]|jgi:hypothetical protein|nr:hypothetical protein [Microcoleus sp. FACHB-53]